MIFTLTSNAKQGQNLYSPDSCSEPESFPLFATGLGDRETDARLLGDPDAADWGLLDRRELSECCDLGLLLDLWELPDRCDLGLPSGSECREASEAFDLLLLDPSDGAGLPECERWAGLPECDLWTGLPERDRCTGLTEPDRWVGLPEPDRWLGLPEPECRAGLPEGDRERLWDRDWEWTDDGEWTEREWERADLAVFWLTSEWAGLCEPDLADPAGLPEATEPAGLPGECWDEGLPLGLPDVAELTGLTDPDLTVLGLPE